MIDSPIPSSLTVDDRRILRSADVFAAALVSGAEPGLWDMIKESFRSTEAIHQAPAELREILAGVSLLEVPTGEEATYRRSVLELIGTAQALLGVKAPHLLEPFRDLVRTNCHNVAHAARGMSAAEQTAFAAIDAALEGRG